MTLMFGLRSVSFALGRGNQGDVNCLECMFKMNICLDCLFLFFLHWKKFGVGFTWKKLGNFFHLENVSNFNRIPK